MLPLFVGLALLMVGNGLLGSLLGIRADLEGFPTVVIGVVMAMYYVGFLVGSLTIPRWLASVGHIRVFAGLSSLAAATALSYSLLLFPQRGEPFDSLRDCACPDCTSRWRVG